MKSGHGETIMKHGLVERHPVETRRSGDLFRRIALVASALLLGVSSAGAADEDYGRTGFFVGAQLATGTATRFRKEVEDDTSFDDGRVDTSVGVGARAGLRVTSRLAVEGQFQWLPGFDYTQNVTQSGSGSSGTKVSRDDALIDSDLWLVTANAKFYLLDSGRFQPYVLGGAGYVRQRTDVVGGPQNATFDEFAARIGLGLDAYITSWLVFDLDVQYVPMTGDLKESDFMSVNAGLQYRF